MWKRDTVHRSSLSSRRPAEGEAGIFSRAFGVFSRRTEQKEAAVVGGDLVVDSRFLERTVPQDGVEFLRGELQAARDREAASDLMLGGLKKELTLQVEKNRATSQKLAEFEQRAVIAEKELAEIQRKFADTIQAHDAERQGARELSEKFEKLEEKLCKAEGELTTKTSLLDRTTSQVRTSDARAAKAEKERAELVKKLDVANQQRSDLKQQIKTAEDNLALASARLKMETRVRTVAQHEQAEAAKNLRLKNQELQATRAQHAELESQNRALNDRHTTLVAQHNRCQEQHASLEHRYEELRRRTRGVDGDLVAVPTEDLDTVVERVADILRAVVNERRDRGDCIVCTDHAADTILLPCGHVSMCEGCVDRLPEPKLCPKCRTEVTHHTKPYFE